jgi:predicted exporter
MDIIRNIILGLLFVSLGFAAFATNMGFDPVVRLGSVAAVGIAASVGSVVFFVSAFRGR